LADASALGAKSGAVAMTEASIARPIMKVLLNDLRIRNLLVRSTRKTLIQPSFQR